MHHAMMVLRWFATNWRLIPESRSRRSIRHRRLRRQEGQEFVVLWSPETAEHDPEYRELGRFPSREKAQEFLSVDE